MCSGIIFFVEDFLTCFLGVLAIKILPRAVLTLKQIMAAVERDASTYVYVAVVDAEPLELFFKLSSLHCSITPLIC